MEAPDLEKYKVWPSRFDQNAFQAVIDGPAVELSDAKSHLVHAHKFFCRQLEDFLSREIVSEQLGTQPDTYERVKAMFETFQKDLQVVTIELESQDDPQVIFETLNARGEPLLPSDLLRNYLFWRASRAKEPSRPCTMPTGNTSTLTSGRRRRSRGAGHAHG